MSRESGVPTFRDALDGLWAKYDPTQLATPQAFMRNPKLVWDWYQYRRELVNEAKPNAGHHALVELENLLPQVIIITQNVDGYHFQVGSTDVISLHGDIQRNKCFDDCQGDPTYIDIAGLEWDQEAGPPKCPYCNKAFVRPDVVWFGEMLPTHELTRTQEVTSTTDVMLVIGTSGMVEPAASLPFYAASLGATVLEINPQPSRISQVAHLRLTGGAAEMLPQVIERVREWQQ